MADLEIRTTFFLILQNLSKHDIKEILSKKLDNNEKGLECFLTENDPEVIVNKWVELDIDDCQFGEKLLENRVTKYLGNVVRINVDFTPYRDCVTLSKEWKDEYLDDQPALMMFIISRYRLDDFKYSEYFEYITKAIKSNKILALQTLWSGIYYNDRASPHFVQDLKTAAQYSNLTMFKYCLYGYWEFYDISPSGLTRTELMKLSLSNTNINVRAFIATLPENVDD